MPRWSSADNRREMHEPSKPPLNRQCASLGGLATQQLLPWKHRKFSPIALNQERLALLPDGPRLPVRGPMLAVANIWYRGANKSSRQRRYPGNASNPALRNCNLLACICVLFSTDRRGATKTYAANAEELVEQMSLYRRGGKAMSIDDLPAIMGTVLIVAGLALVGVSTWSRAEGSEKTTQVGALIIVVGAFLLGLSIFVPRGK